DARASAARWRAPSPAFRWASGRRSSLHLLIALVASLVARAAEGPGLAEARRILRCEAAAREDGARHRRLTVRPEAAHRGARGRRGRLAEARAARRAARAAAAAAPGRVTVGRPGDAAHAAGTG